jgi:hypothetical protein
LTLEIEEAKKVIQRGEDLEALKLDPRFKNVILDGFMGELAEYIFSEMTKSSLLMNHSETADEKAVREKNLLDGLSAIRFLKGYIGDGDVYGDVQYNHLMAIDTLKDAEEALDKIKI